MLSACFVMRNFVVLGQSSFVGRMALLAAAAVLLGFDGDCHWEPPQPGRACSLTAPCRAGTYCAASGTCQTQTVPHLLVTDKIANSLFFEVDNAEQFPHPVAWQLFVDRLNQLNASGHLRKPDGISYQRDDTFPSHAEYHHPYTLAEIDALVAAHRQTQSVGARAAVYVLYLDGVFADDPLTLGLAHGKDQMIVFWDLLAYDCLRLGFSSRYDGECAFVEAAVLLHTFGHLIGLVDNGLAMTAPHATSDGKRHDPNADCVMHETFDHETAPQRYKDRIAAGEERVPTFDAQCLADMRAAQDER